MRYLAHQFGKTVRWRLTLWSALVLCLTFVAFSVVVDRLTIRSLYAQVDRHLAETLATVTGSLDQVYQEQARPTVEQLRAEIAELGLPADTLLQLSGHDGQVFYFNTRALPSSLLDRVLRHAEQAGRPTSITDGTHAWRVVQVIQHPITQLPEARFEYRVLLARDLSPIEAQLRSLRRALLVTLPLILLLAAAGGYFLAGRAMQPVARITAQARHIEAHALHERLQVARADDEFGQLARVLNDLFARLERAFQHQRQFIADAAHELRTPVAILRSQTDVALERPRPAGEYAATLAAMRAEIEHLSALVDDLLLIARADAEQLPLGREVVDVVEVVDEACRALRPLARNKRLALRWEIGDELSVRGDARLLRRAVVNLLANAIKYTPEGGAIRVTVVPHGDRAAIGIADTGIGLAAEDLPHIFARFYRAHRGSGAQEEGSGLGLAIVKMIAELHGGCVHVDSSPGKGSCFTLFIPGVLSQPAPASVMMADEVSRPAPSVKRLPQRVS